MIKMNDGEESPPDNFRKDGMYKVSYYMGSGNMVAFKWFKTFSEATEFSLKVPTGDVIEVKKC